MVIESLARDGMGASGWALSFVQESLLQSRRQGLVRPWVVIEASGSARSSKLFMAALGKDLLAAVEEGLLLWVRANPVSSSKSSHSNEALIPDLVQVLLESALCEGVLLRGFEGLSKAHSLRVWMRRWQLASEKSGTHLMWIHEKETDVLGVSLRLQWQATGELEIRKGLALVEGSSFESLRLLKTWPQSFHPSQSVQQAQQEQQRSKNANRQTERVA
jgi:hypothetical protein